MKIAYPYATPELHDPAVMAMRAPVEEAFGAIGKFGYDAVEMAVRDPGTLSGRQLRVIAASHELAIAAVATEPMYDEDGLSFCAEDAGGRARAVDRVRAAVDLAAAAGAQVTLGAVRGQLPPSRQREAIDAARESFRQVVAHAAGCGVTLSVEPQCRMACNWINTVAEAIEWNAQFHPAPAIVFDLHHAALEEASVHAALIRAMPHISYIQVSDSNRGMPGTGHFPFADTLRVLAALGYDGYLSVECRQWPDSLTVARNAAIFLAPLLPETGL